MVLAYGIAMSTGGVPLIYLGDEVAQLNDYGYLDRPEEAGTPAGCTGRTGRRRAYAARHDPTTAAGQVYARLTRLIAVRQATPELAGGSLLPFWVPERSVVGFQRPGTTADAQRVLVLANVADEVVQLAPVRFGGFEASAHELITDEPADLRRALTLAPNGDGLAPGHAQVEPQRRCAPQPSRLVPV